MKICPFCQTTYTGDKKFCSNCGQPLVADEKLSPGIRTNLEISQRLKITCAQNRKKWLIIGAGSLVALILLGSGFFFYYGQGSINILTNDEAQIVVKQLDKEIATTAGKQLQTPLMRRGFYEVIVNKTGFKPFSKSVEIGFGRHNQEIKVNLSPIISQAKVSSDLDKADLKPARGEKQQPHVSQDNDVPANEPMRKSIEGFLNKMRDPVYRELAMKEMNKSQDAPKAHHDDTLSKNQPKVSQDNNISANEGIKQRYHAKLTHKLRSDPDYAKRLPEYMLRFQKIIAKQGSVTEEEANKIFHFDDKPPQGIAKIRPGIPSVPGTSLSAPQNIK